MNVEEKVDQTFNLTHFLYVSLSCVLKDHSGHVISQEDWVMPHSYPPFFPIIGFIITSAEWSRCILCKFRQQKILYLSQGFLPVDHSIPQIITHRCNITSHSVLSVFSFFVLASGEWASSSSPAPQALPTAPSQGKTQQISRKHTTSVTQRPILKWYVTF